ncbi:SurA N-terminal domain-containing protein [Marinobacter fonticola]|uniref:SurA N-terminal domain-containing protein n=1 Tax=Marinobacter fonticola TaxID=2603215 RepID=UPI0011E7EEC3|nr:SurA N-terminal domain-containing protein [Marinobacter fonticola]
MLQDIRNNAQSTIAKIIIVLLVIGLSMFGVDAIIGGFAGEPEVATVNGQDITEREFTRTVQMQRQRQLAQMENADPSLLNEDQIRQNVLEGLIQEAVLTQDAQAQGLALSEQDVDQLITSMPQFQTNGQFSREAFTSAVRNLGMGVGEFREALGTQFMVNQIRSGILTSAIVNEQTAKDILRIQSQSRSFNTLRIPASAVADEVEVTEGDVEDYYDDNKSNFLQPQRLDVAYLVLSLDDLAEDVEISEQELRDYYDQQRANVGGEEQRRAAHILIESGDDAQAKLDEVQEKLASGEDFGELAEAYSADVASAEQGGDLGYAGQGVYDSAFEEALFSMDEGDVSEPVETQFGYHIIKLTDIRKTEGPSFEDQRETLRQQLAREKAGRRFSELRSQLADISYSEPSLEVPAEELGLDIQTREGVTREGAEAPLDHQGLVRQLFSEDVLSGDYNTEVIDVDNTTAVVAHVRENHTEEQLELAAVSDQIREQLTAQRISEALSARSEELVARLQDGDEPAEVAEDVGAEWTSHESVARNARDVEFDVLNAAFSMTRPADDKTTYDWVSGAQRSVIISLQSVQDGNVEGKDTEIQALTNFLANQRGQREYGAYAESLRSDADIERP